MRGPYEKRGRKPDNYRFAAEPMSLNGELHYVHSEPPDESGDCPQRTKAINEILARIRARKAGMD